MDSTKLVGKRVTRIMTRNDHVILCLTDRTAAFIHIGEGYRACIDLSMTPVKSAHLTVGCATITFEDGLSIYLDGATADTPTVNIIA